MLCDDLEVEQQEGNIMRNARQDEAQAGIKTAGRNINNLRYAVDITLMEESEEELKSDEILSVQSVSSV